MNNRSNSPVLFAFLISLISSYCFCQSDNSPPTLNNFLISDISIAVSTNSETVVCTAKVIDDQSGVEYMFLCHDNSHIALIGSSPEFIQEVTIDKRLSLELSIGYERSAFNKGYHEYFWGDGNFETLSKEANTFDFDINSSLKANKNNIVFFGLGLNVYLSEAGRKKVVTSFFDFKLGHRFSFLSPVKLDVFLENSISFGVNRTVQKYSLNKAQLVWRPGLHMEKPITKELIVIIGMNYGLGLTDLVKTNRYFLSTKAIGFKVGLKKHL